MISKNETIQQPLYPDSDKKKEEEIMKLLDNLKENANDIKDTPV